MSLIMIGIPDLVSFVYKKGKDLVRTVQATSKMSGLSFVVQGSDLSLDDLNWRDTDHGVEMHASSVVMMDLVDACLA